LKSRDEYIRGVYEKRDAYVAARKKKRKAAISAGVSLSVCVIAAGAFFLSNYGMPKFAEFDSVDHMNSVQIQTDQAPGAANSAEDRDSPDEVVNEYASELELLCPTTDGGDFQTVYPPDDKPESTVLAPATTTKTESVDSGAGTLTLDIDEVFDSYFTACHPWPSPIKYKVYYRLGGKFKSGDFVDVAYSKMTQKSDFGYELTATGVTKSDFEIQPGMVYKPVIYLYPRTKTDVTVTLRYDGRLTVTDPPYENGWRVIAYPDGRIISGGREYPYLFWEGESGVVYDMSKGFCVAGGDTRVFLWEKLALLGLNEAEARDFMEFWVPHLERSAYNKICFQYETYTDGAGLAVTPKPDSVLRVFMAFTQLKKPVRIEPQELRGFERGGFAVVEWGGAIQ